MTTSFGDRLAQAVRAKKSVAVIGIDPVVDSLPPELAAQAKQSAGALGDALARFGFGLIDAVADLVPAVKPNIAFFEAHGLSGITAYIAICAYARSKGLLVIGDIKRGDIGSTAAAYAQAHLSAEGSVGNPYRPGRLQFGPHDAVTINPYLGTDSIQPFLDEASRHQQGLFLLVKTSNPSSGEIQDLPLAAGGTVAEAVAGLVARLGGDTGNEWSGMGAVVGATHPKELGRFRELMPRAPILVPGYGAQGGTAADVVDAFRPDGTGAIVNASRSVIYAWHKENRPGDWQGAARRATERMVLDLAGALAKAGRWPF